MKRILWSCCVLFFLGCSSTRKLHKFKPTGQIALSNRSGSKLDRRQVEEVITESSVKNQKKGPVRSTYTTQGGFRGGMELDEIQIVALSKRVAKRFDKVLIESLVDVPEALFRKDYQLTLLLKLTSDDSLCELRLVVLNGNKSKSK